MNKNILVLVSDVLDQVASGMAWDAIIEE